MKFNDKAFQESIRNFTSDASSSAAQKAIEFGKQHNAQVRKDWPIIEMNIKRKALRAAFDQHKELREKLLHTGNAVLVYATADDTLYGAGQDYKGKNWYGRMLMALRDDLRKQPTSYKPQATNHSRAQAKNISTASKQAAPAAQASAVPTASASFSQTAAAFAAIQAPAATQPATQVMPQAASIKTTSSTSKTCNRAA